MKSQERIDIINKIKEYEKKGLFDVDVENDPPFQTLKPSDVDFLRKKFSSKVRTFIAMRMVNHLKRMATKRFEIEVVGAENLENLDSGAIITSNHFSVYESLCVMKALDKAKCKKTLHIVVREGNFFMNGNVGYILKHFNTLPLSSNLSTKLGFMRSVKTILQDKKRLILIYPEQSMWWNYRKPKPHKIGAAHMAVKNNVPIVPCFVTMKNINGTDEFGFPNQKYTINVMPLIYKDKDLSDQENAEALAKKNFELCKNKYEEIYGQPLKYDGSNYLI